MSDDELFKMINAYYAKPGNCTGGSLHIVLDDDNLEDHHVDFCIQWAKDANDADGVALGEAIRQIPEARRIELLGPTE